MLAGDSSTLEPDVNGDGTFDQAFARNSFTRLVVNAGGGDDDVRLLDGSLNVPDGTTLNGQNGNDVLDDTANDEVLVGGAGDDTFVGEAGDDTLRGGSGTTRSFRSTSATTSSAPAWAPTT